MPDRKRQRYGDIDYDWERRVDTTAATVGWRTRLLGLLHSGYQPIEPELFREIMGSLSIDFSRFTFIDIGSGKGRALLLAAEYPFRRMVGVELLSELDLVARQNVAKMAGQDPKYKNIELVCGNAVDFRYPNDPLLIFLFNPLPEAELRTTLKNLERSLLEASRPLFVVYANPALSEVFGSYKWLERCGGTHQYLVFRGLVQ
jgi:SAM-dependent methyltransferase